jgi:hypothetical protein
MKFSCRTRKTQADFFYDATKRAGELNNLFMELIAHPTNPLTNSDLRALMSKRPHAYGRFAGFVGKLKD